MEVEKTTTSKRPNLILNVDGVIFVDILRHSGVFTVAEAREAIEIGTLNGLFVLGRSIGFIGHYLDQSRLKQGLYRHPWDDISYIMHESNLRIPVFALSESVFVRPFDGSRGSTPPESIASASPWASPADVAMRCGDLKRAVEDVVLRPEENRVTDIRKRGTIAALDLCQLQVAPANPSAAAMNACSCSSEGVGPNNSEHHEDSRPPPPLCASSSLDTIVNRPQPPFQRHSASGSRRQSRVLSTFQTKRKRSNSLTNYNKGQALSVSLPPSARHTPLRFVNDEEAFRSSLGSSESHSSVARSDDFAPELVLEEDEVQICMPELVVDVDEEELNMHLNQQMHHQQQQRPHSQQYQQHSACSSTSSNPFMTFRERRDDDDDEHMDCD